MFSSRVFELKQLINGRIANEDEIERIYKKENYMNKNKKHLNKKFK